MAKVPALSGAQTDVQPASPHNRAAVRLLAGLACLPILQGVALTPIVPLLKQVQITGASDLTLRLLLAAPAVAIVALVPLFGRLSDRLAQRPVLIAGLGLYCACGMLAFLVPTLEMVLFSRLLLGIALACIMTVTTALTGDLFEAAERGRVLGLQYTASTLVGLCVPVLAGALALVDWRMSFLLYLSAAVLVLPAARIVPVATVARLQVNRDARLDLPPLAGVLLLVVFWTSALWLIPLQLALHLAGIGATSPVVAGVALGLPCLSGIACGVLYPWLRQRLGVQVIAATAVALIGLGYGMIAATTSFAFIAAGLLVAGMGFGMSQPNCTAWLLGIATPQTRGRAAAAMTVATCTGQLASPFVFEGLVSGLGSSATFAATAMACAAITAVMLSAALLSRIVRPMPQPRSPRR